MARWLMLVQAVVSAAAAADVALNVLAVPWLWKLQREQRPSGAFQAACAVAMAAELATAFVLTSWQPVPMAAIAGLAALAIYKFALIVLAP